MKLDISQINQEACDWVAKINTAEPTAAEAELLKQWINQSPAHEAEIKKMAKLWDELNILTELAVSVDVPKIPWAWPGQWLAQWFSGWAWPVAIKSVAATAAIFFVLTLMWPQPNVSSNNQYVTTVGEQQLITLRDDSTVLLNTNSRVNVEYTDSARNIYLLEGEAHFNVAPNTEKPFRVYAGKSLTRAVGTAFSVYLQDNKVALTVTEGSVEFNAVHKAIVNNILPDSSYSAPVVIKANQSATFNQLAERVEGIATVTPAELSRKLAWQTGTLQFSGDSLEDVIVEISRYTSVSIVIVDPQLRQLRIGGLFKVGETQKMLRTLESSFGIRVDHINEHLIHLSSMTPILQKP